VSGAVRVLGAVRPLGIVRPLGAVSPLGAVRPLSTVRPLDAGHLLKMLSNQLDARPPVRSCRLLAHFIQLYPSAARSGAYVLHPSKKTLYALGLFLLLDPS
jgi:hypothetical protein